MVEANQLVFVSTDVVGVILFTGLVVFNVEVRFFKSYHQVVARILTVDSNNLKTFVLRRIDRPVPIAISAEF